MLTFIQTKEFKIWKPVPEWEDFYEISEFGEVRNKRTKYIISGGVNSAGYERVSLYKNGERGKKFFRHRLVALAFIENPNHYPEVNHKDRNKRNNYVRNLEWCTRVDNERHNRRLGDPLRYKPFVAVYEDGSIKRYEFKSELAKELGVTNATVKNYLQGKSRAYKNHKIKEIKYV